MLYEKDGLPLMTCLKVNAYEKADTAGGAFPQLEELLGKLFVKLLVYAFYVQHSKSCLRSPIGRVT